MRPAFVRESARRLTALPTAQDHSIGYLHRRCGLWIEIDRRLLRRQKLVADRALRRRRFDTPFRAVTSRAWGMTYWNRFERAFLQPECVTESFWRLRYVFFSGLTLGLVSLMTNHTGLRIVFFLWFLLLKAGMDQPHSAVA